MRFQGVACAALLAGCAAYASTNSDQAAIDVCIDHLRSVGGADSAGGEVLSSSFSQAGTEVVLQDRGGTIWRCIAYSDGTIGEMSMQEGADADAIRAHTAAAAGPGPERIQFAPGTTGTEITRHLESGGARQFLIGARAEQFLYVRVAPKDAEMYYVIRSPDGTLLLEGTDAGTEYRGQLWQSGDHIIEVVNQADRAAEFNLIIGIE
ncbi:MAG: hypothetical protein AAGG09_01620 [Pseudomonadota bacterium]